VNVNELVYIDQVMAKESVNGNCHEYASDDEGIPDKNKNSGWLSFGS